MSHRLSIYTIIVSVLVGLTLSSCGSSRTVTTARNAGKGSKTTIHRPSVSGLDPAAKTLMSEAESWVGTPYKYGGNDRGGVDCSGFVTQVYLKALGIKLPRTSREQMDFCQTVDKSRLTPGDLLFFRTSKGGSTVSHVGIFVGENKMIHSSTSQGVIYTDITSDYYSRTFAGAGKIGQYHAMLNEKSKKIKPTKPTKRKDKKEDVKTLPDEGVVEKPDEVHISAVESSAGFTLTPISALPSRATPAATPATSSPETPEPALSTVSVTAPDAELTPEDARAAVLNAIIEKPIK